MSSVLDSKRSPQDLSQLAPGEAATVRRIRGERRTVVRLLEMGLVAGTRVEVKRKAPLGDPLELRVRGYALSIRRVEAAGVEVGDVAPAHDGSATARSAGGLGAEGAGAPVSEGTS
ncbi:FeoA family protein [Chondromyces crocatus]|uniref:Ferrous iron transporter FeoA-like domain-containing protein n=1 Tax=Chondromyces crocatus TaxID=52 RepID=A0A0K1EQQ2_CHOCO|nr:FeoA family protein [Chondromyces crocatus]AKT43255.1 uncharacterized protein CMC5_074860 [Chondromyces crocatus]